MLYLNPPYHLIEGISVFADHADPQQFYFLPLMPHLTQVTPPDGGPPVPQIQLLKYRGTAGNGGFLNFDVNLGVSPEQLDEVSRKLRQLHNLRDAPRLAPVPLVDGTVRMMLFGKESPVPAPSPSGAPPVPPEPAAPEVPQFVLKIDHAAKPALYGENQAAFSVSLDQFGVTVLEEALKGRMSPVGIVYSLEYLGLRPAYAVRLNVDWDRVQNHMDEKFSGGMLFFSVDIEKVVDELIEQRVIVIESDTFVTEDDTGSGVLGRRDEALNQVRDMVTEQFFVASLDPMNPGDASEALDTFQRATEIAAMGGQGCSYRRRDQTRIDRKNLTVAISERTTVKRTIYPQGHLAGLFSVLREPGVDISQFVREVDLDDPFFRRRTVTVISRGDFDTDSILSINVRLSYGNNQKNVLLESSTAREMISWASQLQAGQMVSQVKYSYTVTFKNVDSMERPLKLDSPERDWNFDNLEISPRELYSLAIVPIQAERVPWDRYALVEVLLRYSDLANRIGIDDRLVVTKEKPSANWPLFIMDPERQQYAYQLVYHTIDNQKVTMPQVVTDAEGLLIQDPFPQKRRLSIVPNVVWEQVERIFVDVNYRDKRNDVDESASFEFTAANGNPQTFSVDLLDKTQQLVSYQATVLFKDGNLHEIPTSLTREPRIFIRSDAKGHNMVQVTPQAVPFAEKHLIDIKVEIQYEDVANQLSFSEELLFRSATDSAFFEYDYVDKDRAKYQYRIKYRQTNGLVRTSNQMSDSTTSLVIPVTT